MLCYRYGKVCGPRQPGASTHMPTVAGDVQPSRRHQDPGHYFYTPTLLPLAVSAKSTDATKMGDDKAIIELKRVCAKIALQDKEREEKRRAAEPTPFMVASMNGYDAVHYTKLVTEVNRLAIEFDEIEKPANYTTTRYNKLKADVRAAGEALHKLGGVDLMQSTLKWYVPKTGGLHGCFDRGFDGIGEWVA